MKRRLAAILAADVVGYSALMAQDEASTLAALREHRKTLFDPETERHGGRIVKLMGDGALVEFSSVVDAVGCAVAIQNVLAVADGPIRLRIGINLGDVIVEGDDIYGDGVNIAARLEALAEPGGICVSGAVFDHVKGKVEVNFADHGEHQFKNIPEPLRVYSVAVGPQERTAHDAAATPIQATELKAEPASSKRDGSDFEIDLSLPENPSVAVLPFNNMSADAEQEFFADGISEDIITALSKIDELLVVARNSTFTYKGQAVDVKQVSREQGVRYVLEGSVRKSGSRVRVTAQLIDAATGHHIWAERYDRDLDDIFAIQDEITREVVIALDVRLSSGEQARIWSGGTKSVEAWECVRLGMEAINRVTPEGRIEAQRLFRKAVDLDPNYPMAWVSLGYDHFHRADAAISYNIDADREAALASSEECARKALELDPSCSDAYALLGLCCLSKRDYDGSNLMMEKAVTLAPNHAEILGIAAAALNKLGQPERSFELIKRAMRVCPLYPSWYLWVLGTACRLLSRYESAIGAFEAGIKRNADNLGLHVGLASTLGELGQQDDAKKPASEILRLSPNFSIRTYVEELSYKDPAELVRFEDGLRKAGLPK